MLVYCKGMSTPSIMVRAAITAQEWAELRKLALDRRTSAATLIADALRAAYPLTETPASSP